MTVRRLLGMIGGVALIGGSFLEWIEIGLGVGLTRTGFDLELPVYVNWDEIGLADTPLISAGAVTVVLGLVAFLGEATSRPVLTRVAGVLAVVAVALLSINIVATNDLRVGYWVIAGGALLTAIAGFLPPRQRPSS